MKRSEVQAKARKLTALFLATVLFLTTQDFTVFADSISENAVIEEEAQEDGENENETEFPEEGDGQSENVGGKEDVEVEERTVSGNEMRAGDGTPANPVHHCVMHEEGTDYTSWSYVYFGSYPQSEVTDSNTINAITKVIETSGTAGDAGMDVWVDGVRYRRISKEDTTLEYFGNKRYRYFKWEQIKWKVLGNDGNTLFLAADKAVDCKRYNYKEEGSRDDATWEDSSIRNWLNNSFYNTAFSNEEQTAIKTQHIENDDNSKFGTEGGNDTDDKIYLLSEYEVTNEENGFCGYDSNQSVSRQVLPSDYANKRGTDNLDEFCEWWLRTPGSEVRSAETVYYAGGLRPAGCMSAVANNGVCPALCIDLSSSAWTLADDGDDVIIQNRARMPEANISGGKYSASQKITLSSRTKGAEIFYTIDGTTPSKKNGNLYKGEILVSDSLTVKAVAVKDGLEDSKVMSEEYDFSPEAEMVDIPAPTLGEEQNTSVDDDDFVRFFPGNMQLSARLVPVSGTRIKRADGSETIRIAIGIEHVKFDKDEKWNVLQRDMERYEKAKMNKSALLEEFSQKYPWNPEKNPNIFEVGGFEKVPQVEVCGFYELEIDKYGNIVKNSGMFQVGAEWKGSLDWQFFTPAGPVYLSLGGSGKIIGKTGLSYIVADNNSSHGSWKKEGNLTLIPSVSLEGGYGVDGIATIGAQGKSDIYVQVIPATKGDLKVAASVHVYVIFVTEETYDLASFEKPLWDTTKNKLNAKSGSVNNASSDLEINPEDLKPVDRSYAEHTTSWQGDTTTQSHNGRNLSARAGEEENAVLETGHVLQSGIMPNSLPMIKQVGSDTVMIFQANAPERNTLDSSVLMYSVCSNGTWSKPVPVWDNGTCDMYADMQLVENELYLVWQKENAKVTADGEDGQQALDEMAEKSEICFAKYDKTEKKFKDVTYITSDKKVDMMPKLAVNGDKVTAVWITNSENSFLSDEGTDSIIYADLVNGSFTKEKVLYESKLGIKEFVPYYENGVLCAAYASNTSKENAEKQIFLTSVQGESRKVSEGSTGNANLQWQNGMLYYYQEGTMAAYNTATGASSTITAGDSPIGANGRIYENDGKTAVIWSALDQIAGTSKVYSSVKTKEGFSEPVALYETASAIKYLDGILNADGSWQFMMNTADNAEKPIHSLVVVSKEEASEVRVEDISVEDAAKENETTPISYMVTNTSERTITNLVLTITDGNTFNKQQDIPVSIAPGATFYGTVDVDLTEVKDTTKVKITINAQGQEDTGSNTVEEVVGQTDLSLEAIMTETEEDVCIVANVSNNSAIPADATLTLYGDVDQTSKLEEVSLGEIAGNQGGSHTFYLEKSSLVMNENGAVYMPLVVTSDKTDSNEYNNSVIKIAYATLDDPVKDDPVEDDPVKDDPVKDDSTEDKKEDGSSKGEGDTTSKVETVKVTKLTVSAPSKKLAAGKKVKLTLDVTPENASDKAVTWKTSNKKYATVDKNGKVALKKAGAGKSVTITATAKDGSGKKASIKIKIMKHAVKSIKLKASAKTLKAGKSMSIKATVKTTGKSVNKTLKWQSSNTKYATVNKKGKVTAKKAGKGKTVTITATSTDGSNKKAKVKIKIK